VSLPVRLWKVSIRWNQYREDCTKVLIRGTATELPLFVKRARAELVSFARKKVAPEHLEGVRDEDFFFLPDGVVSLTTEKQFEPDFVA